MEQDRGPQIESPKAARPQDTRRLPLPWAAATTGGWILGVLLALVPAGLLVGFTEYQLSYPGSARLVGAAVGLLAALAGVGACSMQRLVLRRLLPEIHGWGWASTACWILSWPAIAASAVLAKGGGYSPLLLVGLALLIAGAMVGATQWLVIRRQATGACRWILASAVGWCLAPILIGLPAGAITAVALPHCLGRPPVRAANRRLRALVVSGLWLLLAVSLVALLSERVVGLLAVQRLPDCVGRPGCPTLFMPEVKLPGVRLQGASLRKAYLRGANLQGAVLRGADLRGACLVEADLAGDDLHVAYLSDTLLFDADLSDADLGGADLHRANLRMARLRNANLSGADLSEASLPRVWASLADFGGASLRGANLSEAHLSDADLSDADVSGADLTKANLKGAKVTLEQLAKAKSLQGANMPDGTVHE